VTAGELFQVIGAWFATGFEGLNHWLETGPFWLTIPFMFGIPLVVLVAWAEAVSLLSYGRKPGLFRLIGAVSAMRDERREQKRVSK
jgi:hypothetical protein